MAGTLSQAACSDQLLDSSTWTYDSSDGWTNMTASLKSTPPSRRNHQMATLNDKGSVLLFGGSGCPLSNGATLQNDTWIWTERLPAIKGVWEKVEHLSSQMNPRQYHAMANIGNNRVVMFGGVVNSKEDVTEDELAEGTFEFIYDYEKRTGSWVDLNIAAEPQRRVGHAMATLHNGETMFALL